MFYVVARFLGSGTECRGRVVSTYALYLRGPGFEFRPGDRLSWLNFSGFFSFCPCKCRDNLTESLKRLSHK
jgi:hypothetical protein